MTIGMKLSGISALLIILAITGSAAASGGIAKERVEAARASHSYYDRARACPLSFTLPADKTALARLRVRDFQSVYGEALKIQVLETPDRNGVRLSINLSNWDVLNPDDADLDSHLLSYYIRTGELRPRFVRGVS